MDLKVLSIILLYYVVLSSFFLLGGSYLGDATFTDEFNSTTSGINATTELPEGGGFLGSGLSFTRFFGLITIGVGLPSDTPDFFAMMFIIIQVCITIFTLGFIISAIWNG